MRKRLTAFALAAALALSCSPQQQPAFPRQLDRITFSIIRDRHDPVDIVINRYAGGRFVLTGEKLSFAEGGQLKQREKYERKVLKHQYEELEAVLLDTAFRATALADSATDIDGSTWYFGGTRHGFSFTCMWWSPTRNTMERGLFDVVKLGMRILDLAELRIPNEEFY